MSRIFPNFFAPYIITHFFFILFTPNIKSTIAPFLFFLGNILFVFVFVFSLSLFRFSLFAILSHYSYLKLSLFVPSWGLLPLVIIIICIINFLPFLTFFHKIQPTWLIYHLYYIYIPIVRRYEYILILTNVDQLQKLLNSKSRFYRVIKTLNEYSKGINNDTITTP